MTDVTPTAAMLRATRWLIALDHQLFSTYARCTSAMAAMGFSKSVPPPGVFIGDLPDASAMEDIEVLVKFQEVPLMGIKFTGTPVYCSGVLVRNAYYFWHTPIATFVNHLRRTQCLVDTEIVFRLMLATLLLLRRRAIRNGAYFPRLRLYKAEYTRDTRTCSCPNDPIVEDNLVFFRILLQHLNAGSQYTDYVRLLPLFINERGA